MYVYIYIYIMLYNQLQATVLTINCSLHGWSLHSYKKANVDLQLLELTRPHSLAVPCDAGH